MAINLRRPHVYDAVYHAAAGIQRIDFFTQSVAAAINYTDADSVAVSRAKGFEDTNLTEDGRINEADMVLTAVGVRIAPGPGPNDPMHARDVYAFTERGYAELILNDNQVAWTARIRDLVPAGRVVGSGAIESDTGASATGLITLVNEGMKYPADGIVIPRGVRFRLSLRWDRPITLPSGRTARIEAEIWSKNPAMPDPMASSAMVVAPR